VTHVERSNLSAGYHDPYESSVIRFRERGGLDSNPPAASLGA
jgi:hypothetical protein